MYSDDPVDVGRSRRARSIAARTVSGRMRVAVEDKLKVTSHGAYTDNRTAALDDLAKLQGYIQGGYSHEMFVWLTDRPEYYHDNVSARRENSTHHGRVILAN